MKKSIILLSALLALSHGTKNSAAPSAKERKANIDTLLALAYTEGFGEQSSDTDLLKQETISKIKNALAEIDKFVFDSLWVKTSILVEASGKIQAANNKLIDSIRLSRSTDSPETQIKMKEKFLEIITEMTQIIENLEKRWYISEIKKLARHLLINAANHIRDAAQYSIESQKRKAASVKKMPSTP